MQSLCSFITLLLFPDLTSTIKNLNVNHNTIGAKLPLSRKNEFKTVLTDLQRLLDGLIF